MAKGDALGDALAASVAAFRASSVATPRTDASTDATPVRALYGPEDFEERAAILEYDQGMSRADAERIARAVCGGAPPEGGGSSFRDAAPSGEDRA